MDRWRSGQGLNDLIYLKASKRVTMPMVATKYLFLEEEKKRVIFVIDVDSRDALILCKRVAMLHSYRLACLNVSISSHFEHLHHSILQEGNVVVDQNSLVDSTSLAHQADQRKVTISVSIIRHKQKSTTAALTP